MPSDRSYQRRVDLVQQEMAVVKRTLMMQRQILNRMKFSNSSSAVSRYGPDPYYPDAITRRNPDGVSSRPVRRYWDTMIVDEDKFNVDLLGSSSRLSATDSGGFRSLLLAECLGVVEHREDEFKRYKEYAEDLEKAIANKVDWTKDRQEKAIYAFTLVTIVFLPLSAISSIFGMNTSDIRDMSEKQWLYWVVAVPVTLGVIVGGLWWMDELEAVAGWIMGRPSSQSSRRAPPPPSSSLPLPLRPEPQDDESLDIRIDRLDRRRTTHSDWGRRDSRWGDEGSEREYKRQRPGRVTFDDRSAYTGRKRHR